MILLRGIKSRAKVKMKNQLALFVLVGCLIAVTQGCAEKVESKAFGISLPTKAGAVWEYKIIWSNKAPRYNMRAVLTNLPQRQVKGLTVTPQTLVIQGGKPGTRIRSFLRAEDESGLFGFKEEKLRRTGFSESFYGIKNPIRVGTTWESNTTGLWLDESIGRPEKIVQTIESVNEIVTVPAGTFQQCIKVSASVVIRAVGMDIKAGIESEIWFAPSIGIVKATYRHGNLESATIELQAYKL
jgi:hypothetical protein